MVRLFVPVLVCFLLVSCSFFGTGDDRYGFDFNKIGQLKIKLGVDLARKLARNNTSIVHSYLTSEGIFLRIGRRVKNWVLSLIIPE